MSYLLSHVNSIAKYRWNSSVFSSMETALKFCSQLTVLWIGRSSDEMTNSVSANFEENQWFHRMCCWFHRSYLFFVCLHNLHIQSDPFVWYRVEWVTHTVGYLIISVAIIILLSIYAVLHYDSLLNRRQHARRIQSR